MNALKKALVGLGVVFAILIFIGLALPSILDVQRSVTINAPPSAIFPYINDLKAFNQWSPWAEVDPNTQYTFAGPASGVGAKMIWSSKDPGVGGGTQQITASESDRRVEVVLDFGEQGQGRSYYDLKPEGLNTVVTWSFNTDFGYDLVGRYFALMMDDMVAEEYEKGLENLKVLVEGQGKPE